MDLNITERTIEPNRDGGVAVWGHGVYPESSVLAGQTARVFVARYSTLTAAEEAYPEAAVLDHSTKVHRGETLEEISGLPAFPPGWFDPADAGECWDSDY